VSSLPEAVQVGEWRIEPELDLIAREGRAIKIEPRAMRVLLCLVARAGHIVSVSELLEAVWPDVVVGPDSVYQAIALLRRTLGDDRHHPAYIAHIPRKGYRLVAPVGEPPLATTAANGAATSSLATPVAVPVPQAVASAAAATRAGRPRLGGLLAWPAVAIAALGAFYLLARGMHSAPPSAAVAVAVATANVRPVPRAAPAAPSIAVLPFLDMTRKQDLGYLADGISEELIDLLSRGSELRVPARTSSFYFKGKSTTIAEVARSLGVDHVLEGSVRRSGARVRVTVQLIRADSGFHVWSQTYDRDFNELFAVEDDIARAVTATLQARLNPDRAVPAGLSSNGEARNLLLQCQFFVQRNTSADASKAVQCYRRLLALVPQDGLAWAGYADALWRRPALTPSSSAELRAAREAAKQAAEHAIALDPVIAPAHAVLAAFHRSIERNWSAADTEIRAALTSDPGDPSSLLAAAILAMNLGQFERAIALCERARARDPLNFLPYARLSVMYLYLGRLPEAESAARRRLDLSPEGEGGYTQLADVLLARGDPQAALEADRHETDEKERLIGLGLAYHALGRHAEADSALAELTGKYGIASMEIADIYAYRGETERAFAALEQALAAADPALLGVKSDNYLVPLHADARYRALLRKLGLPQREPG
jgi:TolB-like protein/DNA-binding winged helix-turn-helix (wHTH) protein